MIPFEAVLFLFLLITAVVIARLRDLFAAAMLTGISGLLAAGLFTLMDAVDVAFTEAAVGAGISTVLILGTLALTDTREDQRPGPRLRPLFVVILTGATLIYGTLDMPHYGDPHAPIHNHISGRYIEGSKPGASHGTTEHGETSDGEHHEENGAHNEADTPKAGDLEQYRGEIDMPNMVTSVLASYRAYDTFGETTVVLAAGLGVMLLLGGRRREEKTS